jgi:hypothetical protein
MSTVQQITYGAFTDQIEYTDAFSDEAEAEVSTLFDDGVMGVDR